MAYYFHWSRSELMLLSHKERIRFCEEVSKINKKMNADSSDKKVNIFDI
ncbi:MAG: hypothetical protein Q4B84_02485 [Clostridia bacterium]|nr:hypothetical protein [Clostridia bacterium]